MREATVGIVRCLVFRSTARSLALAAFVTFPGAAAAAAQHPSGGSHAATTSRHVDMVGTWDGKFTLTQQGTGEMELLVARDSVYRVKMQPIVDHRFPPVVPRLPSRD